MSISDISLTSGMRSNLTNLQNTVSLLNRTQERLASGKKVNSALDNPINFFTAKAHRADASDLAAYKDGMNEGVQTIKQANNGITALTSLIESAKALASSAKSKTDATERAGLGDQYAAIQSQIADIISDSGYSGTNLLTDADTLTVDFGNGHSLAVDGFDAAANVGNATATNDWALDANITTDIGALDDALTFLRTQASNLSNNLSIIVVRQDFSTAKINELVAGADNLTLADMNEEGANMLMLQTRQSLSTTALSLSAQASQSVLRLFQ
jgi:flagellin